MNAKIHIAKGFSIFETMKMSLKNVICLSIIPQIVLVKWLGNNSHIVESYYSTGIYPMVSKTFRFLLGWVPFSIGDLLYFGIIILAFVYVIKNKKSIFNNKLIFLRDVVMVLSVTYFTFHLMWGMNYYREPLADKLNLTESRDFQELLLFTQRLVNKTNEAQVSITKDSVLAVQIPYTQKELFQKTILGYEELKTKHDFLYYSRPSIKTSLFSTGLSYMGYAGYLNPFTNEAHVNGRLPNFRFPVVSGHEIGHQIGYSAENETNFIGYLVTQNNSDAYFKYAAYAYALGYCLSDIRRGDRKEFEKILKEINPGVKANFNEMNTFWRSFENPLEPIFKSSFNTFLKANNQSEGIKSYNAMVRLLVPYHQKYPL